MRRNRVLYVTAVEDAVNKAVVKSQVFRLLKEFRHEHSIRITYLALIPLRFYFDFRRPLTTFLQYRRRRQQLRAKFHQTNVQIVFFPFLFPFRRKYFYMRPFHLSVFLIQTVPLMCLLLSKWKICLIHARSYPASLLAYIGWRLFDIPYFFEMRGFFPEEGRIYGSFADDRVYRLWKRLEKRLIVNADTVIVESEAFVAYVENIHAHNNIRLIPPYVDEKRFEPDNARRDELRKRFDLCAKFVVVYSGTIGGWHDPKVQAEYFLNIQTQVRTAHFLVLTFEQNNAYVEQIFEIAGIGTDDFTLLNPTEKELPGYLSMGEVGLLAIADLPTAQKAVSVKFGEYLAAGLPVICTPFVDGAAQLIYRYKCGVVVNAAEPGTFERIRELRDVYQTMQQNGFELVQSYLSVRRNAGIFAKMYDAVISSSHV